MEADLLYVAAKYNHFDYVVYLYENYTSVFKGKVHQYLSIIAVAYDNFDVLKWLHSIG